MKEYKIDGLESMLDIPPEKMDAFLIDLGQWVAMSRKKKELESAFTNIFKGKTTLNLNGFVWVDDNIEGITGFDMRCDDGTVRIDIPRV